MNPIEKLIELKIKPPPPFIKGNPENFGMMIACATVIAGKRALFHVFEYTFILIHVYTSMHSFLKVLHI